MLREKEVENFVMEDSPQKMFQEANLTLSSNLLIEDEQT